MVLNNAQLVILAVASALLLGSCAHRYRLQREGPTAVLVPPVRPAASSGTVPALRIKLKNARSNAVGHCDINNSDLIGIHWRGKAADVQLKPEQYFATPGNQRPEETAPRVYLDAQQHLEKFQEALIDREATGCLDNGQRIKQSITERFPFPVALSFYIRFGDYATSGFIDLTSDFHLKVTSPTYSSVDRKTISGHQITYYAITPGPKGASVRISLARASSSPPLAFPESFKFYRLVFRALQSSGSRLATVLSADDGPSLQIATHQLQTLPGNSCMSVFAPGVICFTPDPQIAINPEFAIRVNAKQIYVPPGVTVANVIRLGRGPAVPRNLRVRRVFRGRPIPVQFDPASGDIRKLVLMPGDEISDTQGA